MGDIFGDSVAKKIKDHNGTIIIPISAYDLDYTLSNELVENRYIVKSIAKPIELANLIGSVYDKLGHVTYPGEIFCSNLHYEEQLENNILI